MGFLTGGETFLTLIQPIKDVNPNLIAPLTVILDSSASAGYNF